MNRRKAAIRSAIIVVLLTIAFFTFAALFSKSGFIIEEKFKNLTGTKAEKPYEIRILGPDCIGVIAKPMQKSNIGSGMDIYNRTESFFKAIEELQVKYRIKGIIPIIGGTVSGSSTPAIILVVEERR